MSTIESIIDQFESKTSFSNLSIVMELSKINEDKLNESEKEELLFNLIIFRHYNIENRKDVDIFNMPVEIPDKQKALDYWKSQANRVTNPLLKVMYSGISWEYAITERLAKELRYAEMSIDAANAIAVGNMCEYEFHCKNILKWALKICYGIRSESRKIQIRDAIIRYEDLVSTDMKCGLWGFSYSILIESGSHKDILNEEIESKILSDLIDRFDRLIAPAEPNEKAKNHYPAMMAAGLLMDYYRKKNDAPKRMALIERLFDLIKDADFNSALVKSHHLQTIFVMSKNEGFKDLSDKIGVKISEVNEIGLSEYKSITHEQSISQEEVDQWSEKYVCGTLQESLNAFALDHFPPINWQRTRIDQQMQSFISGRLMGRQIVDHRNRPIVSIGTYPEDSEGILYYETSRYICNEISALFRREAFRKIFSRFDHSTEILVDIITQSPIFDVDRAEIYKVGIDAYFKNDWVSFLHIMVPQIEEAIRDLYELAGGSVYKTARSGGLQLKLFDDLVREQIVIDSLGDLAVYLKIIYTDPRGLNIRNNLCHGFYPIGIFNYAISDIVFYTIICLAQLRFATAGSEAQPDEIEPDGD